MDKKQRLTKWTEWEIGAHYCWAKGKTVIGYYVCVEVNEKEGHVRMQPVGSNDKVQTFNWRGRFTRIGAQNCPAAMWFRCQQSIRANLNVRNVTRYGRESRPAMKCSRWPK
jgi:hypothetical protein